MVAAAVAAVQPPSLSLPPRIPRCYETKSTAALELEILDGNTESVLRVALVTTIIITLQDKLGVEVEDLVDLQGKGEAEEEEEEEEEEEGPGSRDRSVLLRHLLR